MAALDHKNLQIGQVLYVVSDKQTRVIPVVVSEQATIKTLTGNTTTWKVIIGPKNKRKSFDLQSITGEKFYSLAEARHELLSRFTSYLDEVIETSEKEVFDWYDINVKDISKMKPSLGEQNSDSESFDPDSLFDEDANQALAPGSLVKAIESTRQEIRLEPGDSAEVRREKLRLMAQADIDEDNEYPKLDEATPQGIVHKKVKMPDGSEVLVAIPQQ